MAEKKLVLKWSKKGELIGTEEVEVESPSISTPTSADTLRTVMEEGPAFKFTPSMLSGALTGTTSVSTSVGQPSLKKVFFDEAPTFNQEIADIEGDKEATGQDAVVETLTKLASETTDKKQIGSVSQALSEALKISKKEWKESMGKEAPSSIPEGVQKSMEHGQPRTPVEELGIGKEEEQGIMDKIGGALKNVGIDFKENPQVYQNILGQIAQAIAGTHPQSWQYQMGKVGEETAQGTMYQKALESALAGKPLDESALRGLKPELRSAAIEAGAAERKAEIDITSKEAYDKYVEAMTKEIEEGPTQRKELKELELASKERISAMKDKPYNYTPFGYGQFLDEDSGLIIQVPTPPTDPYGLKRSAAEMKIDKAARVTAKETVVLEQLATFVTLPDGSMRMNSVVKGEAMKKYIAIYEEEIRKAISRGDLPPDWLDEGKSVSGEGALDLTESFK